jgi:hypothetical protein
VAVRNKNARMAAKTLVCFNETNNNMKTRQTRIREQETEERKKRGLEAEENRNRI